jgi:hypothetical protein
MPEGKYGAGNAPGTVEVQQSFKQKIPKYRLKI